MKLIKVLIERTVLSLNRPFTYLYNYIIPFFVIYFQYFMSFLYIYFPLIFRHYITFLFCFLA